MNMISIVYKSGSMVFSALIWLTMMIHLNLIKCQDFQKSTKGNVGTVIQNTKAVKGNPFANIDAIEQTRCFLECELLNKCKCAVHNIRDKTCTIYDHDYQYNFFEFVLITSPGSFSGYTFFSKLAPFTTVEALEQQKKKRYTMVFRAAKRTGYDFWAEWNNVTHKDDDPQVAPTIQPGCVSLMDNLPCDRIYRHSMMDGDWTTFKMVKMHVYKNGVRTAGASFIKQIPRNKMNFASNAAYFEAFNFDLVKEVKRRKTSGKHLFNVKGMEQYDRRFFWVKEGSSCEEMTGWFTVLGGKWTAKPECEFDHRSRYPVFLYPPIRKSPARFNDMKEADVFVLWVRQ